MKCPKCGENIRASWEPTWIEEYFEFLRTHSISFGKGTGDR